MTINDMEALVRRGESERIEFKKTTGQLPRVAEIICGFLNGHGGVVVIGVTPEKRSSARRSVTALCRTSRGA